MPRPIRVEALSDDFVWRLTSVVYIGNNWRTERPRKTKIGTHVAHVTRDSGTAFKVKGQGHQAGLLTASFTHSQLQRSAWERIERGETAATLKSAGAAVGQAARGTTAPTQGGEWPTQGGEWWGILCRNVHSLFFSSTTFRRDFNNLVLYLQIHTIYNASSNKKSK